MLVKTKTGSFPSTVQYGRGGECQDRCALTLYGDVAHPAAQFVCDAAGAGHPDEACLTDHQKVAVSVRFAHLRPYGETLRLLDAATDILRTAGWPPAKQIEGQMDSASSVCELAVDESLPPTPAAHGYNATRGFTVVVERVGTAPRFTAKERAALERLAAKAMKIVFGTALTKTARY